MIQGDCIKCCNLDVCTDGSVGDCCFSFDGADAQLKHICSFANRITRLAIPAARCPSHLRYIGYAVAHSGCLLIMNRLEPVAALLHVDPTCRVTGG